jgi:catechol 2,3-dioxygenase-like lactoylglutathione lyase family enzyme
MADIATVALLVLDYDEAIAFYTEKLGFELVEDSDLGNGKRWVQIAPKNSRGTSILLAKATTDTQRAAVGDQAGGRVWLFLHSDNFWQDYHAMQSAGVIFAEPPREEPYATVVVFSDLYGNKWDLLQKRLAH